MSSWIRLDKYLSDMGVGTRSEVREKIQKGRVQVDGKTVKIPKTKVQSDVSTVLCEGKEIVYHALEYYMMNKPAGWVCATTDPQEKTVLDLMDQQKRKDLSIAGRLDKDTEGLVLLTNDGMLIHQLLAPGKHVGKLYYARVRGCVSFEDVEIFAQGMQVEEDFCALPAKLIPLSVSEEREESEILLELWEGKFHQVKRMFTAVGKEVLYLKRWTLGALSLDEKLEVGQYRALTAEELESLKNSPRSQEVCLPKDVDCVIFDMDGTLVDSMWVWGEIDQVYLGKYGLQVPADLSDEIRGMSVMQTALYFQSRFGIQDTVEEIIAKWNEMAWEKYTTEVPLKPGALLFLKYLQYHKIPCAIATSNSGVLAQGVLQSLKIRDYFAAIVTGEEIHNGKPAPDVYLEAARRVGVSPAHCFVFEDIPDGLQAAKAAGMRCAAIEDASSAHVREQKRELADYYIKDYYGLFNGNVECLRKG